MKFPTALLAFVILAHVYPSSVLAASPLNLAPVEQRATKIIVDKSDHTLILMRGSEELARYRVSFGRFAGSGPKRRQGDRKTPEGTYTITERKANSTFHLALRISYPNADDISFAKSKGWTPGGDIMIHGGTGTKLYRRGDWTLGCIAVTNAEIEKIWPLVAVGTPIVISQ